MRYLIEWSSALALVLLPCVASAQVGPAVLPQVQNAGGHAVGSVGALLVDATGAPISNANPLPTIGKQETFQLVAANTSLAPVTTAGGDYILSQTCTSYGTLSLQVLGPDGVTWQTMLSRTASDTAGGSGVTLGSYAGARVIVMGTTGCNALLSRVPS